MVNVFQKYNVDCIHLYGGAEWNGAFTLVLRNADQVWQAAPVGPGVQVTFDISVDEMFYVTWSVTVFHADQQQLVEAQFTSRTQIEFVYCARVKGSESKMDQVVLETPLRWLRLRMSWESQRPVDDVISLTWGLIILQHTNVSAQALVNGGKHKLDDEIFPSTRLVWI